MTTGEGARRYSVTWRERERGAPSTSHPAARLPGSVTLSLRRRSPAAARTLAAALLVGATLLARAAPPARPALPATTRRLPRRARAARPPGGM
jgi:hypothetical protein